MIVSDVMTRKVLSVAPDETVEHAVNLMLRHGISGLFVVDTKGALVGVVTEGDLLRRVWNGTAWTRAESLGMPRSASGEPIPLTGFSLACAWGRWRLDVFATAADGKLYNASSNGSWSAPAST